MSDQNREFQIYRSSSGVRPRMELTVYFCSTVNAPRSRYGSTGRRSIPLFLAMATTILNISNSEKAWRSPRSSWRIYCIASSCGRSLAMSYTGRDPRNRSENSVAAFARRSSMKGSFPSGGLDRRSGITIFAPSTDWECNALSSWHSTLSAPSGLHRIHFWWRVATRARPALREVSLTQ